MLRNLENAANKNHCDTGDVAGEWDLRDEGQDDHSDGCDLAGD
jgi:hypothetical protein